MRDIVRVQMADIGSAYTTAIGDSAHKALGLTSEMNKEFLMAGRYRDMMSTGRLSTSSFLPHLGKMGVMETIAKEVGVDASLLPKTLSEGWANTPERLKAFQAQLAGFKVLCSCAAACRERFCLTPPSKRTGGGSHQAAGRGQGGSPVQSPHQGHVRRQGSGRVECLQERPASR